ncbi:putative C6 transcription factor [Aspergillus niger CBS 101883]|uniref:Fungal-specific transcription factor domain protein n=1 Tax=Aspergillus niger ATCC 13496 TaxID=1353008 RepID=A0A370BNN1_ASPNG|nr:fungal specific transcription factor domain protein [Aspergillus niger CBS 513.88]XP_025458977.1 fungal-specific transcription factor domain protein [Aspergillus niger CBS 101883]PYH60922.1 fungal-specific transcription factor domain protein [Aspergillus niger CBS 101883]RDH16028.1 fungal-specific transcription factor domain protein [Aspergillus niger ATCC 13496]|eukprot:XP_001393799.2 fungal specific transcription factor domain protein [Aspergillus niger CBS 513.88]
MEPEGPESEKEPVVRRACDQCRLRKIRCDKRSPCSNCRSSQIICRSTGAGQKPPEPKKRVLISSQYERKIDLIEERLGNIERTLLELRAHAKGPSEQCHHSTPLSSQLSPSTTTNYTSAAAALDQHESTPAFEGNSSLAAHSAYAREFLETAVSRSALQMSTPKISTALASLKQIVNMQDHQAQSPSRQVRFPNQRVIPGSGLRELTMPPAQVVLALLRKCQEQPSILQAYLPFLSTPRLVEKCRQVYFSTEDYSDATFIVVNGALLYLISDVVAITKDSQTREEYDKYLNLCLVNLETALGSLNLLMPANDENIEALALGAVYAIEMSKPSFAMTLTSAAFRLCQTLGYHRSSPSESGSKPSLGNILFWTVYVLDKAVSLRLGRASTIQDYDVTSLLNIDMAGLDEPYGKIYVLWVRFATIQGKVYELLYSPAALARPESERAAHARQLASEVQQEIMEPFEGIQFDKQRSPVDEVFFRSDKVARLSVLTLIYRAIPPQGTQGTFIHECIETARSALEVHQGCMAEVKEMTEHIKAAYFHWTILYAPFVPFIVIFCHAIAVSSWDDLARLEDFVASLQPNCFLSEAISKLYQLCQVLSNVARLYIEAKEQVQVKEDQDLASVGQEFDVYLSALGLAPMSADDSYGAWASAPVPAGSAPGDARGTMEGQYSGPMPQTSQLGNWFSGNQHMMGLLEEDISLFDPSSWT